MLVVMSYSPVINSGERVTIKYPVKVEKRDNLMVVAGGLTNFIGSMGGGDRLVAVKENGGRR